MPEWRKAAGSHHGCVPLYEGLLYRREVRLIPIPPESRANTSKWKLQVGRLWPREMKTV